MQLIYKFNFTNTPGDFVHFKKDTEKTPYLIVEIRVRKTGHRYVLEDKDGNLSVVNPNHVQTIK